MSFLKFNHLSIPTKKICFDIKSKIQRNKKKKIRRKINAISIVKKTNINLQLTRLKKKFELIESRLETDYFIEESDSEEEDISSENSDDWDEPTKIQIIKH